VGALHGLAGESVTAGIVEEEEGSGRRLLSEGEILYSDCVEWDVGRMIVKTGDDLRQEQLAMQLICLLKRIVEDASLTLWFLPYRIITVAKNAGLIEPVPAVMSLHELKQKSGLSTVRQYFESRWGDAASPSFIAAQRRFAESMAAYSLATYFLQVKDRHNGNILLDHRGRVIHIDFGFMLGTAPGQGIVAFEDAPFKLTQELVDVLLDEENVGKLPAGFASAGGGARVDDVALSLAGGDDDVRVKWENGVPVRVETGVSAGGAAAEAVGDPAFSYFQELLLQGFIATRAKFPRLMLHVQIAMDGPPLPFNTATKHAKIMDDFRQRFALSLTEEQLEAHVRELIRQSLSSWRSSAYDSFQRLSNGIL